MTRPAKEKRLHIFLLTTLVLIFVWSLIGCFDLVTWILETAPVVIGAAILPCVYRRFRLSGLHGKALKKI